VEELLNLRWDWEDLLDLANDEDDVLEKVIWITDNTFLVMGHASDITIGYDNPYYTILYASSRESSGGQEHILNCITRFDADVSIGACSVFWRAIETISNSVTLTIGNGRPGRVGPSGPVLSQLLRRSPSLQDVCLHQFDFKEEQCRALATLQRTGLKIKLSRCAIEFQDSQQEYDFIEWFRHNQIVTELDGCNMESSILCALSGNNSVKRLVFPLRSNLGDERIRALTQALATNQGIEDLDLSGAGMNEEACRLLLHALTTHPRIKVLSIGTHYRAHMTDSARSTTMHAIIRMLGTYNRITTYFQE
jgi:hypothetical protein